MKKILVTGATGFIGSHLIRDLVKSPDYRISVVKRRVSNTAVIQEVLPQLKVYDLNEDSSNLYSILKDEQPDIVVHLATLYLGNHKSSDIGPMLDANILFGVKLLDAMAEAGVKRFINTGTFSEYSQGFPDYLPASLYASTKRAFQDILKYYIYAKGFQVVTLKLYDTYGPHDPRPKLFSILKKILRDQSSLEFSPGEQSIDLLYIDDATAVFKKAIEYVLQNEKLVDETIFAGTGVTTKVKDIVATFEEVSGRKLNILWGRKPYRDLEIMVAQADIRQAREKLGWQPKINLKEGLTKMLAQEKLI